MITMIVRYCLLFLTLIFLSFQSFGQCYTAGQNLPSGGYILRSSGYRSLDSIVIQEIINLQSFFQVKVDFFFLQEYYGSNAMYDPRCNYNCNGSVFLGTKMLYEQLQKEHGIECVKAILAHEFGHCVQHIMGWKEAGKRVELHSDFMAGYYTGRMYNYDDEQVQSLFSEFYSIGDYNYWSLDHHGTKYERKCAFEEGYYFAKENFSTVVSANSYAIQYVAANNPCGVRKYKAAIVQYQNELERRTKLLEKDISSGNTGSIKFKCNDKKKYKIVTTNAFGQQVVYIFNKPYIGLNQSGQQLLYPAINEVNIGPISANTLVPYSVFKVNWFFGDLPMFQFTSKICAGNTVEINFEKNAYSIDHICP